MRTQTLSDYYNEERESQYPTTFDSYGAFVPASLLCKILKDTIELFSSIGFEFLKMRMLAMILLYCQRSLKVSPQYVWSWMKDQKSMTTSMVTALLEEQSNWITIKSGRKSIKIYVILS